MPSMPSSAREGPFVDWPSIEAACLAHAENIAWCCVKKTPAGLKREFQRIYPGPAQNPNNRSRAHEELRDIAYDVLLFKAMKKLRSKALAGKVSFENSGRLRTYLSNDLLGHQPAGCRFMKGSYIRRLQATLKILGRIDSLEVEQGGPDDSPAFLDTRESLGRELQHWRAHSLSLSPSLFDLAKAAAVYLVRALHTTCPVTVAPDDYRAILENCRPDCLLADLSAVAFKSQFQERHKVDDNAFDLRTFKLRKSWREFLMSKALDVNQSWLMRLISAPRARRS